MAYLAYTIAAGPAIILPKLSSTLDPQRNDFHHISLDATHYAINTCKGTSV